VSKLISSTSNKEIMLRPAHTEGAAPSRMPFDEPKGDLFPPICIKSHWDPTAVLRHILPDRVVSLPTDFRPLTKVCKKYVTSGPAEVAPLPPRDMVFPSGGEFYAPGRYSAAIDAESSLRTLDHKLDRWCTSTQYIVSPQSTMYKANYTVPRSNTPSDNPIVSELAMPQALLRTGPYYCRAQNDSELWRRSGRLFNNPTKQDKFGAESYYDESRVYPHGGVVPVKPTAEAAAAAWPVPMPGGMTAAAAAHAGIKPVYERPLGRPAGTPVGVNSATWQAPA